MDRDKEVASLRNHVETFGSLHKAAVAKNAYYEKKIRCLEEQVAAQPSILVAVTPVSATPPTLESIIEEMRRLKLENASLKNTIEQEREYEEVPDQKKRKRHDETPQ